MMSRIWRNHVTSLDEPCHVCVCVVCKYINMPHISFFDRCKNFFFPKKTVHLSKNQDVVSYLEGKGRLALRVAYISKAILYAQKRASGSPNSLRNNRKKDFCVCASMYTYIFCTWTHKHKNPFSFFLSTFSRKRAPGPASSL